MNTQQYNNPARSNSFLDKAVSTINKDTKEYYLMGSDNPLLLFIADSHGSIMDCSILTENPKLLPIQLITANPVNLSNWLRDRSIDTTRSNARLLLSRLEQDISNSVLLQLSNNGVSITDNYWIKESTSTLTYSDVRLTKEDEEIYKCSLLGAVGSRIPMRINPELSNIGSFNKAWKFIDGQWYLVKNCNIYTATAELLAYEIGKLLDMDMAEYQYKDKHIYSKNFLNPNESLEHYASLLYALEDRNMSDLSIILNMQEVGFDIQDIVFLDSLLCNSDRHAFNFGVIKDNNTGNFIRLAPNFDNNLAFNAHLDSVSLTPHQLKQYLEIVGVSKDLRSRVLAIKDDTIKEVIYKIQLLTGLPLPALYNQFQRQRSLIDNHKAR